MSTDTLAKAIVVIVLCIIAWVGWAVNNRRIDECMAEGHTKTECRALVRMSYQ